MLLRMRVGSVRRLVAAGRLDPTDLESICLAWGRRVVRVKQEDKP
jgi:hypothetical protein